MADPIAGILTAIGGFWSYLTVGYEQALMGVVLFAIGLLAWGFIVWRLFGKMAHRDPFGLEEFKHSPVLTFLLYTVAFPALSFLWVLALTIFIIFLSKGLPVSDILGVAVTMVVSVRALAYLEKEVAKDFATLIPISLLAVLLVEPSYISPELVFKHLLSALELTELTFRYLVLIVAIEWFFRLAYTIKGMAARWIAKLRKAI
jgi:hypothetical protein